MGRSFWLLLLLGVALRCVALQAPIVDSGLLRQAQTAAVTRSLQEQSGFSLSTPIPWAGDSTDRFVLELPVYNFLVIAVDAGLGQLTTSGRLVSVVLWALSFVLLQPIWRRLLPPDAIPWANLLALLAPLSGFYSQAFMPESLMMVLTHGFVLALLLDREAPGAARWWTAVLCGLLAVLIKAPLVAHLYLLVPLFALERGGWRALFAPRYLLGGLVTLAAVVLWSRYSAAVNTSALSFGDAGSNLAAFIGSWRLRFELQTWKMIALYVGGFLVPGACALVVALGLVEAWRRGLSLPLAGWLGSLVVFYLLWLGNGPASQGYYNLPAVGPLAALFGLGATTVLSRFREGRARRCGAAVLAGLCALSAAPVWVYLFLPDRPILAASRWAHDHTEPGSLILFRAAHRVDLREYTANAVFPFYAERPAVTWSPSLPEPFRTEALQRARYAVVTQPLPEHEAVRAIRGLRGFAPLAPEPTGWLTERGFTEIARGEGFVAFRRQ